MNNTVQFYVEDTGFDDRKLMAFTSLSWGAQGWDVEIRDRRQAEDNPHYAGVHANMKALTRGYGEGARAEVMYNRWLGHCPGWTADYDIVNMGFTPEDAQKLLEEHHTDESKLFTIGAPVRAGGKLLFPPTPTFLTEKSLDRLLGKFETFVDDGKLDYVDDQNLIGTLWRDELVEHTSVCAMYNQDEKDWLTAPLIHFSSWSIDRTRWGRDRSVSVIKALRLRRELNPC